MSYPYTGSCRSPGFVNPEASVKAKTFSHDGVLEEILEMPNLDVPDVLRCLTTLQALQYDVSQGSLPSKETKAICLASTAKEK